MTGNRIKDERFSKNAKDDVHYHSSLQSNKRGSGISAALSRKEESRQLRLQLRKNG